MNLCESNAYNMWEEACQPQPPPPESEEYILEVHDCTCKDLSFHNMGPETILTHFQGKRFRRR